MSTPLHDWLCDGCGRKVYGRRKIPRRCHGVPMRPMGSPWKYATDRFYDHFNTKPKGTLTALPDDYWVSEPVIARLQIIVDESDGQRLWQSSIRGRGGPTSTNTYAELSHGK